MVKLLNMNDDDDEVEKPSSAQIVASIDDLLIEIIHRLPLKPLVQLTLVSKTWNSLIFDQRLCSSLNRAVGLIFEDNPYLYLIFLDESTHLSTRKINPFEETWYRHCEIMHSCNGLLLCVNNKRYYNLSTESICGMSLAFNPSKTPHYKVVCVLRSLRGLLHSFEVYSSETGSWRRGGELLKAYAHFDFQDGVYWNRAIHWVNIIVARPRENNDIDPGHEPREPVYFSLDCNQTPKVFPKPPLRYKCYDKNDYYFGESCNHLHFVDADRETGEFNVYEMKRDYSEWFVKYKVNVPRAKFRDGEDWFMVVRGKNDEEWFLFFGIEKSHRIAWYNLDRNTCKTRRAYWAFKRPFQYTESHCSV
ncbi:hypothetical protein CASFOL_018726 [Castilleja foliolosa]|uniref:F-box domain-containing protein n=1 Tax=Castilleja foliolosa TaxID=1961234 RepID=A0ABD3D5J4_9LAMI